MVAITNKLGRGIYTPSEAALYARVQTALLNRWLKGKGGDSVIDAEYEGDEKSVSFLDFVQALAIRDIRLSFPNLTLQKIRQAYQLAREKHGVEYPFAMPHKTFLFGDDSDGDSERTGRKKRLEIVINLGDEINREYVQLTGRERGNRMIAEVSELYMRDLTFTGPGGVADSYRPLKTDSNSIIMRPTVRFGEPVVEQCGYTAFTLFNAYRVEGSITSASKAYGVDEDDVVLAIRYVDYLQRTAA